MVTWLSAMTTTPLTPQGLNSWKTGFTIVPLAAVTAASIRSRMVRTRLKTLGSHPWNSSKVCWHRAFGDGRLFGGIGAMGFISGRGLKLLEDRIGSAEAPDVGLFEKGDTGHVGVGEVGHAVAVGHGAEAMVPQEPR